jgi:hypothetical protein
MGDRNARKRKAEWQRDNRAKVKIKERVDELEINSSDTDDGYSADESLAEDSEIKNNIAALSPTSKDIRRDKSKHRSQKDGRSSSRDRRPPSTASSSADRERKTEKKTLEQAITKVKSAV